MKRIIKTITCLMLIGLNTNQLFAQPKNERNVASAAGTNLYSADSASIASHYKIPDWFRDGKFGIFIHWGVYSVPAYGSEWYARWMYETGSKINLYHTKTYGAVDKFGYKDFIPLFTAEKFDANAWADIIKASGATYVVPVAEHHDGFSMYNSKNNPYNSVNMGPKRDIIGELSKAIKTKGLYFGLSSHRAENAWFFSYGMENPSDVNDSSIAMYGEKLHEPGGEPMSPEYGKYIGSNKKSREEWLKHTHELIDQYKPDLIWFDWTVGKYPFQSTFYQFLAYYYNNALDWKKEVVVNTKFGYGDNIQVFDIERGKSDRIRKFPWQTDTSIGKKSWSHCIDEENKSSDQIIDDFVDIVSKNGNLLLNIGPKADGTITNEQQYVLSEIGKWLKVNGEAIYGTRPWVKAGEGKSKGTAGYMTDGDATKYSSNDIRFTVKNNNLYANVLEWGNGETQITSLGATQTQKLKIKAVSLLGSNEKIEWQQTPEGLKIKFPKNKPTAYAHSFKIELSGFVLGEAYLDKFKDRTLISSYLANHSDKNAKVKICCAINNNIQKQEIIIGTHQVKDISFMFPIDCPNNATVRVYFEK